MAADDRSKEAPATFSAAWWKRAGRAVWLSVKDLFWDDGTHWSAAIAYYALLSFIPILLLVALTASVVIDSDLAVEQLGKMLGDLLPDGEEQVEQIVERAYAGRAVAGFVSVIALLWSGTRIFGSTTRALNVAYDIEQSYGFVRRFLMQAAMLVFFGGLIVVGLLARTALDIFAATDIAGIGSEDRGVVIRVAQVVFPFLLTTLGFTLVYRFVPRHRPAWIPAIAGALIAGALFWSGRGLFFVYLRSYANYNEVYGPIAVLIILVFWVWIGAMILLFGGQLVSHFHEILVEGADPDEVEARHREARQRREGTPGNGET